ncbi:response regulator transcription factor [Cellulomonas sp. KRMCY2]|uniref:response regulator n=1 Tax=Cellulomonas sp. KRMCY2 TaxID=1304865 RepID=UPI00045E841A|nr:response regulator transcription factor [Cellulomonas sp. KRMCY2]
MTTILLADDHGLIRGGIRMILQSEDDFEIVGEAADGAEAVDLARSLRPDLVLMDVQMPGLDGLEATRQIVAAGDCAVLILTTFNREDYLFQALQAGASGFLLKNSPPEDLISAVRVVARGDSLLAPELTRRLFDQFMARPAASQRPDLLNLLTEREEQILRLMANGDSNAEIAVKLFVGDATVKTHVSRVLNKLGLRDRVQAVVYAYETGVVSPGDNPP